jgi:hypothetical protein
VRASRPDVGADHAAARAHHARAEVEDALYADGAHVLAFPAKRVVDGWIDAANKRWIDVRPTHWRKWAKPL